MENILFRPAGHVGIQTFGRQNAFRIASSHELQAWESAFYQKNGEVPFVDLDKTVYRLANLGILS